MAENLGLYLSTQENLALTHLPSSSIFLPVMNSWNLIPLCMVIAGLLSVSYLFGSVLRSRRLPPGPWGLPILGHLHMLGKLPHRSLHKLANKYGPIMYIRLGLVPTIVISSPEAAELVLKTHDLVFANRSKTQAVECMSYGQRGLVFAEYGSRWRNLRKLCTSQLLNHSKIESMKPLRKQSLEGLVRWLVDASEADAVVDLSFKVGSLIQEMTFGMIMGGGKDNSFDFISSIKEIVVLVGAFNIADYVPFVGVLDLQGLGRRIKTVGKVVDGLLEDIVDQHIQGSDTQLNHYMDFIDVLLASKEYIDEHEEKLDRASIKAIILDMIGGAMDTSSTAIEWALSELFKHPRVMKKLQLELEEVVGMDKMVEESDFAKLEYLDLVVKETLRLHTVVPLFLHESVEDVVVNGYCIPKKTRVLINAWAIGRDRGTWSHNVNEFYPERFIGMNFDYRGHDLRFIPFGSGRRSCPGLQLGITTVRLVIAQLIHCFNWELPNGLTPEELDRNEKFGLTMPRANHLHAKPTFRLFIPKL